MIVGDKRENLALNDREHKNLWLLVISFESGIHIACFLDSGKKGRDKMLHGIYNVIDASLAQKIRFDCIANNLANVNTNGHKKDFISFDQTLTQKYKSQVDFSNGAIRHTGNDLDLAIEKDGFFKVDTVKGPQYTRNGGFSLNAEGVLTTRSGEPVMGESGPIEISGGRITIDRQGQVMVDERIIDRVIIVNFDDLSKLVKSGKCNFSHPDGAEAERTVAQPVLHQGYVEQSNVNPTTEMIKMIETYRTYESNQKAIQTLDEMTRKLVNGYAMQQ